MYRHNQFDDDEDGSEEEEELCDSEDDADLDADIEALRRACMLTNADASTTAAAGNNHHLCPSSFNSGHGVAGESDYDSDDDDIAALRDIRNRLSLTTDLCEPLSMKPLCILPPELSDDEEDVDLETLRAIQRRFSAYNFGTLNNSTKDILQKPEQVHSSIAASEDITSNSLFANETEVSEWFPDSGEASTVNHLLNNNVEKQLTSSTRFPKSAQLFIDAIKRNRSYQKFLQSKLTQIEARIEENKKLRERVKLLKEIQVTCRRITGRALSQRKDPHVQLISRKKSSAKNDSKVSDTNSFARLYGPEENSHVANYTSALAKFPLTLEKKKWSEEERENLGKGIRRQLQEMMLQVSVYNSSCLEGSSGDKNCVDNICVSVKDREITPEEIRIFLPKVNWDDLASMYVKGRTGAECEARWLNCEDPLINHNEWTPEEDKKLLFIVQEKGITNWIDIAVLLGTNRTPFQCLARYQRSLNVSIMEREWTAEEDEHLCIAVEAFGESNWQSVASTLNKRTGTQCSNRWKKSLHPAIEKRGRWTLHELKSLKVAVMLFGPKNWNRIAQFVPGRSQVQCRERWVETLDPSLNFSKWTEEEDLRLDAAVAEHGYCWTNVAACMPSRTRKQCCRRWKALHPDLVPLLQEARRRQKASLVSNFVDRECERPALALNVIMPLPMIKSVSEPTDGKPSRKHRRKSRGRAEPEKEKDAESCIPTKKSTSKRCRKVAQTCSDEALEDDVHDNIRKKKTKRKRSVENNCTEPTQDHSLPTRSLEMGTPKAHPNKKTPNKKKAPKEHIRRAHKQHIRSNLLAKPSDEEGGGGDMSKVGTVADLEPESFNLEVDADDDNITLACFLSRRSKKRPTTHSKNGNSDRTRASVLPCNSKLSYFKDVQIAIANGMEPAGLHLAEAATAADNEPMSKPASVKSNGDLEAGDAPLACSLNNQSKRRK